MNKIIYPWNIKESSFDKKLTDHICFRLKELGYFLPQKKINDDKLLSVIEKILPTICEDKWFLIASNCNSFIQELSNLLPVIYSINTTYSCATVDTEKIFSFIKDMNFNEDSFDKFEYYKLATLLIWNNINLINYNYTKYASAFYSLLSARGGRKCSTIFTVLYDKENMNKNMLEVIFEQIRSIFGDYFISLLKEKVSIIDIPLKKRNPLNNFGRIEL